MPNPRLRALLKPLETGKTRSGGREGDGPWFDTTEAEIQHLRREIAQFETIAAKLRVGEAF
jgi:hypothetical protein